MTTTSATLAQRNRGLNGAPDYPPMVMKILTELADGDLNTLKRFYNWHSQQPQSNELNILKFSADHRKEELRVKYPITLNDARNPL